MHVITYLRVSTESQLDGYGLDVQEQACRAYAEAHNLTSVATFVDAGVSGTKPAVERPGLLGALELLAENKASALLAARLDRVAREVGVQEAILGRVWGLGCEVHTVDVGCIPRDDPDDPMRTAMRQMAAVFAQLDRAMITKRLRDGRRRKAELGGKAHGAYPYGWSKTGPIPEERAIIAEIIGCLAAGQTLQAVADQLNQAGKVTRWGRPWTVRTVHNIASRNQQEAITNV